jgi:hypothetical protein
VDDGSTGNAVTFNSSGANTYAASFTVTLDDATAGTITFNGNTGFAGSSALSAGTSRNINVASGAVVSVVHGNLTLSANQQVTPTAGAFVGVLVNNGVLQSTGTGVVSVTGRGGNTGALQFGVQVAGSSARIQSTTGNVAVTGTGGASDNDTADGVRVESNGKITTAGNGSVSIVGTGGGGAAATAFSHVGVRMVGSEISTVDGPLSITGTGGAPSNTGAGGQYGVVVLGAAQVKTTGSGTLTLDGRGGGVAGSGFNEGVQIANSGTLVTVKDGQLTITGTYGAGSGGSALDIDDFASVTSTGTANMLLQSERSIIVNTGAVVSTVNGNLTLSANQQTTPTSASFVGVTVVGTVSSTGSGVVSVAGRGGNSGTVQFGVRVAGSSARIQSTSGNITVTGTGGASDGHSADGVRVESGGKITTAGSGSLTIIGTGGAGAAATAFSHVGVRLVGSEISTVDGPLSVTGTGGAPSNTGAGGQYGVVALGAAQVKTTGSGTLTLDGRGGGVAGSGFNEGVQIANSGTLVTVKDGQLTITGTYGAGSGGSALDIDDFASVTSTGTANMLLQSERSIVVNTGAVVSTVNGNLTLSANQQTTPTSASFVGVTVVGTVSSTGSGVVSVVGRGGDSGTVQFGVRVAGSSARIQSTIGNVTVTGTGGASDNHSADGVRVESGGKITTAASGSLTIVGTGGGGAAAASASHVGVRIAGAEVSTVNGALNITGTGGAPNNAAAGGQYGLVAIAAAQVKTTGNGSLTLDGRGGGVAGSGFNEGVQIANSGTLVTAKDGQLTITGTYGAGSGGSALDIDDFGSVTSTGTAEMLLRSERSIIVNTGAVVSTVNANLTLSANQQSTPTSANFVGVTVVGTVSSTGTGNVLVRGKGGDSSSNSGINVNGGRISGGIAGSTVTVQGTGGGGAVSDQRGVTTTGALGRITSLGGNVIVTGQGGGGGTGQFSYGVDVRVSSTITAGGSGTVTVTGTGGQGSGGGHLGVHVLTAGVITSSGGNVSITGTASLGAGASDVFADSGSTIGVGGSGTLTINGDSLGLVTSGTPAAINAGANTVTIRQRTTGTGIDLGGLDALGTPNTLGLTDAELDCITAGTVIVGDANSGPIRVSAVISPANYQTLSFGNNVNFAATGGFSADVGPTAASYEKMTVSGTVTITSGATLAVAATGGYVWNGVDSFTLLANDASDAIVGTFTGPPLANFLGSTLSAAVGYARGTGNDLLIVANAVPVAGADGLNRPNTTKVAKVLKSVLLGNDIDADSDPLTLTAVGNALPAGATVTITGNFVVYTAPANNAGNGSFTYTLSDGPGGHTATGTVTVTQGGTSSGSGSAPNAVGVTPSGNDFVISFLGVPGGSFRVQYTTSTAPPYVWNEFAPPAIYTAAPNGAFTHTDVNPPSPARFYRAVSNP